MPNRIVREGINDSSKVDKLDYEAEVFYRRLINVVDDYGRYDARPTILRSKCYPMRVDKISDSDISRWLQQCAAPGVELVIVYEFEGKPYLELQNLGTPRAKFSKYPPPFSPSPGELSPNLRADEIKPAQTQTNVPYSYSYSNAHSYSNSSAHSDSSAGGKPPHARAHGRFLQPVQARKAATDAFSAWSELKPPVGRGHPVDEIRDEHTVIWNLVEELSSEPPISRQGDLAPRQTLIWAAVEALMKSKKHFRNVKFATGCVRSELEHWASAGIPAAEGERAGGKRSRVDEQMSVIDRAFEESK